MGITSRFCTEELNRKKSEKKVKKNFTKNC